MADKVPKVYVENQQDCLVKVFEDYGWLATTSLQDCDIVVLMGGADIDPSWYGQLAHPLCGNPVTSWDERTAYLTKHAFTYQKPIIGICRGAQFINAVVGGSMYQHVDGHSRSHDIEDLRTGDVYHVNSIHHQMMIPAEGIAEVLAVAVNTNMTQRNYMEGTIPVCLHGKDKEKPEVEAIWYKHIKGLCFQSHPEYAELNSDTRKYFYHLLSRLYQPSKVEMFL
jgi:gamma-glutamyl-gamma-aminobutyrate hydrolase PuuD